MAGNFKDILGCSWLWIYTSSFQPKKLFCKNAPRLSYHAFLFTVERILLTYLRTLLTYRKLPFADKLGTLEKNKGRFILLELNSGIIKWPYFFPKVFSL